MTTSTYARERMLQEEIAPAVERTLPGVEVLAVELVSPSRFCVYVDHPSGVDHALCERVTRVLDPYLADYTIDVSSPGAKRPLRRREHFTAYLGRRAAIRTGREVGGRTRFRGEVVEAGDDAVGIALADGEVLQIPYDAIVRGNLIDEGWTT
jgi:ribosome maturation factor RimP